MTRILFLFVLSFIGTTPSQALESGEALFSHTDQLMKTYVIPVGEHQSKVDYTKLKAHRSELDSLVKEYEAVPLDAFKAWSQKKQIAFLIDAYNVMTFKLIVDNYPVSSIRNIGGLFVSNFSNQWKKKFFNILGGKAETLDTIEQDILRKEYHENRIHFALVCASKSCPPIRNEAYVEAKLEQQLNDQRKKFIQDPERNLYKDDVQLLNLSMIFKWYRSDFVENEEQIKQWIAPFISDDVKVQARIKEQATRIRYLDYNWNMND
ncbi:MAG: DUF547 domain-containing protein [Bdellovibrionales bacterium]|nr:DUF547 domain-containing protein [Oligoflexia bacterium]